MNNSRWDNTERIDSFESPPYPHFVPGSIINIFGEVKDRMSKTGRAYVDELLRKFPAEYQITNDTLCVDCGLRKGDHFGIDCPTCPLCSLPSPVGEVHNECADLEE